uniref:Uncharacterized protein n=1 Tax=Glossina brevipalpis TaxID=37001 RepID=A0A1A9WD72_9MUSC
MFSRNLKFAFLLVVTVLAFNVVGLISEERHQATNINTSTLMPPSHWTLFKEELLLTLRNLLDACKNSLPEPVVLAIKHIWQDIRTIKEAFPLPVCSCLKIVNENLKLFLPKLLSFIDETFKREQPLQELMQKLFENFALVLRDMIPFVEQLNTRIVSTNPL